MTTVSNILPQIERQRDQLLDLDFSVDAARICVDHNAALLRDLVRERDRAAIDLQQLIDIIRQAA